MTETTILQDTSANVTVVDPRTKLGPTSSGVSDNDTVTLCRFPHSFIYRNGNLSPLEVPKAKAVETDGITGAGVAFGFARKGNKGNFGFAYDGTTFTNYSVPGSSNTIVTGVSAAGVVVGFYDEGSVQHGFIYRDKKYITIDYPGASSTSLSGMSSTGSIIGTYVPTGSQVNPIPFIGVCSDPKGCTE